MWSSVMFGAGVGQCGLGDLALGSAVGAPNAGFDDVFAAAGGRDGLVHYVVLGFGLAGVAVLVDGAIVGDECVQRHSD